MRGFFLHFWLNEKAVRNLSDKVPPGSGMMAFNFLPANTSCDMPSVSLVAMLLVWRAKKRFYWTQPQQHLVLCREVLAELQERMLSTSVMLGVTQGDEKLY